MFYGKGYPATVSSGYSKAIPTYSSFVQPGFGFSKGFGKPFGKGGFGKGGFGKGGFGKGGFGKPFGIGFPGAKGVVPGFGATKSGGFSSVVPATTVATTPFPGAGI